MVKVVDLLALPCSALVFALLLSSDFLSCCTCSHPIQANEDITQIVEILTSGPNKWNWMTSHLVEFTSSGSVLLFVTKKANAEELANNLKQEGHDLGLLHGDMDQSERNKVISDFKKGTFPVLVATDVAGRDDASGLKDLGALVELYSCPTLSPR